MNDGYKLPPYDLEAEEGVLGSILIDPDAVNMIRGELEPSDFYSERNGRIYEVSLGLDCPDQITIAEALNRKGWLDDVGGAAYLSHLVSICPTSLNVESYAEIVTRLSVSRRLITAGEQVASMGYTGRLEVLDSAVDTIDRVRKTARQWDDIITTPKQSAEQLLQLIDATKSRVTSLPYGYLDLDRITTGLYPKDLVIIGARPSMGKTQILQEIANRLSSQGHIGLLVSIEMGIWRVHEREIAMKLGISVGDMRRHMLSQDAWGDIADLAGEISERPLYYVFQDCTSSEVISIATRMKGMYGLDFLMLDYVQLLRDCRGVPNTHQALSNASKGLKNLAKELDIPVIIASQLSREVERSTNKHPQLVDLKESGSLEEDCDVALLLYRDEVYYPTEQIWRMVFPTVDYPKGILEIKMAKNRQLGTAPAIKLVWDDKYRCYRDYAGDERN